MSTKPILADAVAAPVVRHVEIVHPDPRVSVLATCTLINRHGGVIAGQRPSLAIPGATIIDCDFPGEAAGEAFRIELGNVWLAAGGELVRVLVDALNQGTSLLETRCANSGDIHVLTEMRPAAKVGEAALRDFTTRKKKGRRSYELAAASQQ